MILKLNDYIGDMITRKAIRSIKHSNSNLWLISTKGSNSNNANDKFGSCELYY